MKIIGAHTILYSKDAEADRAFLRDILNFPNVDVGHGWLIFGLPPSEVAIHPGAEGADQEFYFLVDDISGFITQMESLGRPCTPVSQQRWGALTTLALPSGAGVGVYQPKHARPENPG
jgi:catechol 2,3-dioxygenase-like lactoylglutathione lyase family enzyme